MTEAQIVTALWVILVLYLLGGVGLLAAVTIDHYRATRKWPRERWYVYLLILVFALVGWPFLLPNFLKYRRRAS